MLKTIELENAIIRLFSCAGELNPLAEEVMDDLDRELLVQTVRHYQEPVYAYRTDTCEESGCNYRGDLLFPVQATLLFAMPYVRAATESGISFERRSELWLLEDMTLAVVSCVRIRVYDGEFKSEYRTLKTKDLDIFPQVIDLDYNLLAIRLGAMCDEYLESPNPTYEL